MPDSKYWLSYKGIDIRWSFPVAILGAVFSCILVERFWSNEAAFFLFVAWIVFIAIVPMVFNGISTPFEKARQVAGKFGGPACQLSFADWNPVKIFDSGPFYMLVYEDGIEIRTFFTAFFVPYEVMDRPEKRWGGLSIGCRLPDFPLAFHLTFANRDKPYAAIQRRMRHIRSLPT